MVCSISLLSSYESGFLLKIKRGLTIYLFFGLAGLALFSALFIKNIKIQKEVHSKRNMSAEGGTVNVVEEAKEEKEPGGHGQT